MSQNYGQWIYVWISLHNAGATFELAQAFSKLSKKQRLQIPKEMRLVSTL